LQPADIIETGQIVTFDVSINVPSSPGTYSIYFDMVRDGVTWFREKNNIEWKVEVNVVNDVMSVDTDMDGVPDLIEEQNGLLYWHPDDGICGDALILKADISGQEYIPDCYVNFYDLLKIADSWLTSDSVADISGPIGQSDSVVDFYDFAFMASQWMDCNNLQDVLCW
jgi:hypothetical protein